MNCPRCNAELKEVLTRQSVLIDVCPNGHGVWLDGGEIYFFVKKPRAVEELVRKGIQEKTGEGIPCLRCSDEQTDVGRLVENGPIIDLCRHCRGMWFDRDELGALNRALGTKIDPYKEILKDSRKAERRGAGPAPRKMGRPHRPSPSPRTVGAPLTAAAAMAARGGLNPLPNLALSSTVVLSLLYGVVFALFVVCTLFLGVNIHLAFILAIGVILLQYIISPFLMDLTLQWIQSLDWVDKSQLPPALAKFMEETTSRYGMPFPRVGIIRDGTPNAFTYGHSPHNARVVVTRGLLEILNEDEVNAVVAHELGHALHWDILIMTLAGSVPVILYYIYRILIEVGSKGGKKSGGQIMLVALAAFVLYYISQYVVLYLSRIREYYADRFGGEATGDPNTLATALVKVAYGIAGKKPDKDKKKQDDEESRKPGLESVKAFGIFDPTAARGLAISSMRGSTLDVDNAIHSMQWDLWNPWALYYEINSTHPLPAKRIQALGSQAKAYGQQPTLQFNLKKPESYWDEFAVDLLAMYAPLLCAGAGALVGLGLGMSLLPGLAALGLGTGYLVNLLFSYRANEFLPMTVAALLKKVKVSSVRPVPVNLKGKVIGRGVPGLIWSEDIVIRDDTGFIYLDYRQPLRIIEFFFGILRTKTFIGKEVTVTGWYRRAPVPYIEIKNVKIGKATHTCYVYTLKIIIALLLLGAGIVLLAGRPMF